jgi:hypothetical protein
VGMMQFHLGIGIELLLGQHARDCNRFRFTIFLDIKYLYHYSNHGSIQFPFLVPTLNVDVS